ncbi:MAG TPA: hypothetical protein DIT44_12930, partial [Erythrobacter sp.]|nr:hypothetical protein [Erythrobacter sp.]
SVADSFGPSPLIRVRSSLPAAADALAGAADAGAGAGAGAGVAARAVAAGSVVAPPAGTPAAGCIGVAAGALSISALLRCAGAAPSSSTSRLVLVTRVLRELLNRYHAITRPSSSAATISGQ